MAPLPPPASLCQTAAADDGWKTWFESLGCGDGKEETVGAAADGVPADETSREIDEP